MIYAAGSKGSEVVEIKHRLQNLGYLEEGVGYNSIWDDLTTAAVKEFQQSHNLNADGQVGPLTWQALFDQPMPTQILGTKNLNPAEYRCQCCGQLPPQWRDGEVPPLLIATQKLRDRIGKPIHITPHGGYRCPDQNKISDGAGHSQHLLGKANDIWVEGMTPAELAAEAEQIPEFRQGGIGIYPGHGFTHCDIRDNGPARWQG